MIVEVRNAKPFIHFGFNKQVITTYVGVTIKVWQDTIYNKDIYNEFDFSTITGGVTNKSLNSFEVTYGTTGVKEIKISNNDNKQDSNVLTIKVVERTFGATDLFWGDTNLTFND